MASLFRCSKRKTFHKTPTLKYYLEFYCLPAEKKESNFKPNKMFYFIREFLLFLRTKTFIFKLLADQKCFTSICDVLFLKEYRGV